MTAFDYLTFILLGAVQVGTPGPATVFVVNNAVQHGPGRAILALSGDTVATLVLASLSAAGVAALLAAHPALFTTLRLVGAAYLVWLGVQYFRAPKVIDRAATSRAGLRLWLQSFAVGISNPKAILFFGALFPQFVPPGSGVGLLVFLVASFLVTKFAVLALYAFCARQIKRVFSGGTSAVVGRRITGGIFLAFAAVMGWGAVV